ncbi:MAG: DNA-processing protein DprA, partial [Bacteroidetes bacterium]|nr:DNA-processing protein DprA [Bacteroidota bacterium]
MENNGNENFRYVYFLRSLKNAGDVRIRRILEAYRNAEKLESASDFELIRIEGISKVIIDGIHAAFRQKKEIHSAADKMLEMSEKKNIRTVTILDDDYPENLRNIYDPPPLLYYKGELLNQIKYSISIV